MRVRVGAENRHVFGRFVGVRVSVVNFLGVTGFRGLWELEWAWQISCLWAFKWAWQTFSVGVKVGLVNLFSCGR